MKNAGKDPKTSEASVSQDLSDFQGLLLYIHTDFSD